jgi:hypothetical protein
MSLSNSSVPNSTRSSGRDLVRDDRAGLVTRRVLTSSSLVVGIVIAPRRSVYTVGQQRVGL